MRFSVSPNIGKSAVRVLVAAFLASAATGCSSDVSRFGGLFSRSDNITTSSIPHRNITGLNGEVPVPTQDVAEGNATTPTRRTLLGSRDEALNQPFPTNNKVTYDAINTSTTNGSGARLATTPTSVERVALADPTAGATRNTDREVALAQPFPASRNRIEEKVEPDPLTTGTAKAGWTTFNAASVKLKPGESVATLSKRYGVPEKEILKANGLKNASAVVPGQSVVIPTYGKPRNIAKTTTETAEVPDQKNIPIPGKNPDQVAVLPTTTSSRDKSKTASSATDDKLTPADGGKDKKKTEKTEKKDKTEKAVAGYVVKPGDSLAKIAKANGTSVQSLKAANGMNTASLRIGQTLKIPAGAGEDQVKTASIPKKVETKNEVASTGKLPEEYKAPVAKQTVAEVEKKTDVKEDAPETTGIGKYRWPVRGAVVAGYGANVEGSRNDGIDISVPEGTPIKAAENGVVIYAGNGLKELGNTVLVRHDDGTVTVYGHADAINVARGQKVTRGETLAASGMSGNAKTPKVHFEVRKDATPVNPMTFLQ